MTLEFLSLFCHPSLLIVFTNAASHTRISKFSLIGDFLDRMGDVVPYIYVTYINVTVN